MGGIKFNKQNNRLKRVLPGEDHFSALVFYSQTYPNGFGSGTPIKAIADIAAAETAGITAAHGSLMVRLMHYHVSELFRLNPDAVLWVAVYPVPGGEHTFDELDAVRIFSNGKIRQAGVLTQKAFSTGHIALLQDKYDASFNAYAPCEIYYSPNLAGVDTGDIQDASALTSPNVHLVVAQDGAASGAALAAAITAQAALPAPTFTSTSTGPSVGAPKAYIFTAVMQAGAAYTLQIPETDIAITYVAQGTALDLYNHFVAAILASDDFTGISVTAAISGGLLRVYKTINNSDFSLTASVAINPDALTSAVSVGVIGAQVGATSLAKVNENTGWVEKFNMAVDGGELDVPALANGDLVSALAENITKSGGTLDAKRLIFLKKYPAYTGTYFNDTHGCCPASSDFAYAEDNRTLDKAIRGIYISLLPRVNGPVLLDETTGQLSPEYLDFLTLEASKALEEMEKAQELSGYAVTIDPNQDVNATSQIVINISNSKIGVSRNLVINIGY